MRRASAVIPRLNDGRVLLGARTPYARSWPGALAFPGGAAEDADDALPLWSDEQVPALAPIERAERATAMRELGEETGLWLLRRPRAPRDAALSHPEVDAELTRLSHAHDVAAMARLLRAEQLAFDDEQLIPLVLWRTWGNTFSVRQFLLPLDAEPALPSTETLELSDLGFVAPDDILTRWRSGEAYLMAPILRVVTMLAAHHDAPTLIAALRTEPSERDRARMELVEGAVFMQARTPTLPPASHTNSPLLGTGDYLLVDPATPYPEEQARFDDQLVSLVGSGKLHAVFLTHHHIDHMGDAKRLSQKFGVPVWAHAETAKRVDFKVDRTIVDGEHITLGSHQLQALHTPGHAPGHLCLWDAKRRLLVAGDMIAGVGSVLIDPADGHMGTYLASLERLIALHPRALLPSHGFLMAHGEKRLREQLAHRHMRQAAVRQALSERPQSIKELVPRVYRDTPRNLWPLAERALGAALTWAVEHGEAVCEKRRQVITYRRPRSPGSLR